MKTKLIACLFAVVMFCTFSAVSMADPIKDYDMVKLTKPVATGTAGGPFNVFEIDESAMHFQTFCLELNESVTLRVPYTAMIDDAAIRGGISGGNPDPLDNQTAYLFSKFTSGFAFDVDALQVAIWMLEGEYNALTGSKYDSFEATAQTYLDMPTDGWVNNGKVQVMNLYDYADRENPYRQSTLIYVPEPMTLLLLGLGLVGLGITRKKYNK